MINQNNYPLKLLTVWLLLLFPLISYASDPPDWDPDKIITHVSEIGSSTSVLRDSAYSGYLFNGVKFYNGLNIRSHDNVYFYNCEFYDKGVKLAFDTEPGKVSDPRFLHRGNNNITFDNCLFKDVTANGIVTEIKDAPYVDHLNLVIKNCTFDGWGEHDDSKQPCEAKCDNCDRTVQYENPDDIDCIIDGNASTTTPITGAGYCTFKSENGCERCNDAYNKFDHGLYVRSTEVLIENNEFIRIKGGSAISIRNSGTVKGNKIYTQYSTENPGGIGLAMAYWDQYNARGDKTLLIENNVIIGKAQHKGLVSADSFLECTNGQLTLVGINDERGDRNAVNTAIFRFNTIVMLPGIEYPGHSVITIKNKNGDFNQPGAVSAYGNLIVDLRQQPLHYSTAINLIPVDADKNLLITNEDNFLSCDWDQEPYDLRLQLAHKAWNFNPPLNANEPVPVLDKDGNNRSGAWISAGAYQYIPDHPLFLSNVISTPTSVTQDGPVNIASTVEDNATLTVESTDYVTLEPGFVVENGGVFNLELGCDDQTTGSRSATASIEEVITPETAENRLAELSFFPNPSFGQLFFEQPLESVAILDQSGRVVASSNGDAISKLDISNLRPAMYFVQMKLQNQLETKILIKR